MMKKALFICLILNCNLVLSQKIKLDTTQNTNFDSIHHKRIYDIYTIDYPLGFELIEMNNGGFVGNVKVAFIKKEDNQPKEFITKTPIVKDIVKKLMIKLDEIGIENIIDCEENNDCIIGYDGSYTGFVVRTYLFNRKYLFWGLHLDDNIDPETPYNRKQAEQILKVLDENVNFKQTFLEAKKRQPKGKYYFYYGGGAEGSFENK